MAITDFKKAKDLKVTEVTDHPIISRTACLKITSGMSYKTFSITILVIFSGHE